VEAPRTQAGDLPEIRPRTNREFLLIPLVRRLFS
jgi:hypothetical protein